METAPRRLANRCMADNCRFLLAYAWKIGSGTKKISDCAASRQKKELIPPETLRLELGGWYDRRWKAIRICLLAMEACLLEFPLCRDVPEPERPAGQGGGLDAE